MQSWGGNRGIFPAVLNLVGLGREAGRGGTRRGLMLLVPGGGLAIVRATKPGIASAQKQ